MGNKQIVFYYAALAAASIFLFSTMRWYSYRVPEEERTVVDKQLELDAPELKDLEHVNDAMDYFQRQETVITREAGTFPFVNVKTIVITTRWSRPSWKGI